jgi:hypothetical protein
LRAPAQARYPVAEPDASEALLLNGSTPLPVTDGAGVVGLGSGVGVPEAGGVLARPLLDEVRDELDPVALLVQLADGLGLALPFALPDGLALGVALGLALGLAGAVAETLGLGLALPFGLALPVALSLWLALGLGLSVGLGVVLPEDETGGLCGGAVGLGLVGGLVDTVDCGALVMLGFAELDELCGDGDEHATAVGLVIPGVALPSTLAPEE